MEQIQKKIGQILVLILGMMATWILYSAYTRDLEVAKDEIESQKELANYIATLHEQVSREIAILKEETGDIRPKDVKAGVDKLQIQLQQIENEIQQIRRDTDDRFRGKDMREHIETRIEPLEEKVEELTERLNGE